MLRSSRLPSPRSALLAVLLAVASAPVSPAQGRDPDEGRAVAAFNQQFRRARDGAIDLDVTEKRREALLALESYDSARVARALCEAFAVVDAELEDIDRRRAELIGALDGRGGRRTTGAGGDPEEALRALRSQSDDLRHLRGQLGARIRGLRSDGAVRHLLRTVLPDRRQPLLLRRVAGEALGTAGEEVVATVGTALQKAREPEEALALLEVLRVAGPAARPVAADLVAALAHDNEAVRELAALVLAYLGEPSAVEPMIALLESHAGQSRVRVVVALEILTGLRHGMNVLAWQQWWQDEGPAFVAAAGELGRGEPRRPPPSDASYYHGIPQEESASILYCIDCSGSMDDLIERDPGQTRSPGSGLKTTRLEACKAELITALGTLRPDQRIAILWYDDGVHWWKPKTELATPEVVTKAREFVRELQPGSTTNIHDALEQAFSLVGRGARDRYYGTGLDTIFLLTDGSPTRPDGSFDRTRSILAAVRSWNPLQRVTIHTIGIGPGLDEVFLADLAAQNGGEFKRL